MMTMTMTMGAGLGGMLAAAAAARTLALEPLRVTGPRRRALVHCTESQVRLLSADGARVLALADAGQVSERRGRDHTL